MIAELQFHDLVRILRRRRRMIIVVSVAGGVVAGSCASFLPARYTAKAQLIYEPQYMVRPGETTQLGNAMMEDAAIATQVTTLLSHAHEQMVLEGLDADPKFVAALQDRAVRRSASLANMRDTLARSSAAVSAWLPRWIVETAWWRSLTPADEPPAPDNPAAPALDGTIPTSVEFERHLRAFQETGSHVIAVVYTAHDPEIAAAIADRTIETYVASEAERKRVAASRELDWLGERVPALRADLERIEREIQDYEAGHGVAGGAQSVAMQQNVADLGRKLAGAEEDVAARQARITYAQQLGSGGVAHGAMLEYLGSPLLASLASEQAQLAQSEADLSASLGPSHPKVLAVHGRLAEVRRRIAVETKLAFGNLHNDAAIAASGVTALREKLDSLQQLGADAHLRDLRDDATVKRQLFNSLVQHQEELSGQQSVIRPDVRVLSLAAIPDRSSSPSALLFVPPGIIVAMIAGCMAAILGARLDVRMRTERDVSTALDVPCLASMPFLRRIGRRRPHQNLLDKPFGAYAESVRSLVASLRLAEAGSASRNVLVTSSLPGEGKTTVAVSLATYVASLGRRVLLVDLDFRHASTQREIGSGYGPGVMELLRHECAPSEAIRRVPDLKFDYLPMSKLSADPFALFASNEMGNLLAGLREGYDCVVIDGPPLLVITEARLLAAMVDRVALVVKWGSTRRDTAQRALDVLRGATCALAGPYPAPAGDSLCTLGVVLAQVDAAAYEQGRYGDTAAASRRYRQLYIGMK